MIFCNFLFFTDLKKFNTSQERRVTAVKRSFWIYALLSTEHFGVLSLSDADYSENLAHLGIFCIIAGTEGTSYS